MNLESIDVSGRLIVAPGELPGPRNGEGWIVADVRITAGVISAQ